MRKVYVVALAVALLGISPLFADDASSQAVPRPFVSISETTPALLMTTVTIGNSDQPPLPCWDCVSGASVHSLGIAQPLAVVTGGNSMTVTLTWDDLSYIGRAQFAYAIRTSPTAPPIQAAALPAFISPGGWWGRFIITVPSVPGAYMLQGSVTWDGFSANITSPLVIQ